jgi:hypothetical protein
MQEDLHVTAAQMGTEISPKLVDSKGNIYSTGLTTVEKFSGSNYQLLATAGGQSAPAIDLMWGYTPLGWRYDFLLVMSQFGDCHIRVADLPVSVLGVNDLAKLWDGQGISARHRGCVAGAARVGTCATAGSSATIRSRAARPRPRPSCMSRSTSSWRSACCRRSGPRARPG